MKTVGVGWRFVTFVIGLLIVEWVRIVAILSFVSMQKTKVVPWAF